MLNKLKIFKEFHNKGVIISSVKEISSNNVIIFNLITRFFKEKGENRIIKATTFSSGSSSGRNSYSFVSKDLRSGYESYLKINLPGDDAKRMLETEYLIYRELGRKMYEGLKVSFHTVDETTAILEMPVLKKCDIDITPDVAWELTESTIPLIQNIYFNRELYNIFDILKTAEIEIGVLKENGLIGYSMKKSLEMIEYLKAELDGIPKSVSHGDFGDANILMYEDRLIAIDWEDVFYGIQNYDYLYWLTFFNHRKYYCKDLFGKTKKEQKINIAVMVMILIIKESMSFYNGEYKNNKLTAEDRIGELLAYL